MLILDSSVSANLEDTLKIPEQYFTIIRRKEHASGWEYVICLNPDHPVYSGHFPGRPVVPGVLLIGIVQSILEMEGKEKIIFRAASSIKFLKMIIPDSKKKFKLNIISKRDQGVVVTAELADENSIYFKFKGTCEVSSNK